MGTKGGRPDGTIDFEGYSTEQLRDLECTIDRDHRPLDFAHLQAELERRDRPGSPPEEGGAWAIEFTPESGLRGWLRAKAKRLRLYGRGSLEIDPSQIILSGWQRTWLGMPIQVELPIPLAHIRNVAQDERSVRFEVQRGNWRRRYEFRLDSSERAALLVSRLPAAKTPGFDQGWRELREFNGWLRAREAPRVTQILVAVNVVVFIAMAIATRRIAMFGLEDVVRWGANNGPLTTGGQWWRLLSAEFLHFTPLHLLINMWVLWNIGRLTERLFGRWTFLALYLAVAVLASLSSIAWNPLVISVGASGAIFGVFGAFLAYLQKRQTRVPRKVIRAHWLSTLVFVLFSLVSGALQAGIDNAAHVGGLVAGFCLGWILARPLEAGPRRFVTVAQASSAGAVVLALALAGLWEVGGIGARLSSTQQYFQKHLWYVDGETRDLALWQQLIAEDQSGLVSNDYVGQQFKSQIIPFWQSADDRLRKEHLRPQQSQIGALMLDFVRARLAWAQAVAAEAAHDDSRTAQRTTDLSQQTTLALAHVLRLSMLDNARTQPPGLVNSPLVERLRELALAGRWECVMQPAVRAPHAGPRDLRTDLPVVGGRIACDAERDFVYHDFGALESLLAVRTPLADLPAGGSTYAAAVSGLDTLFEYGRLSMGDVLRITAEWRRAYPGSSLPALMEAMAFEEWAWSARGGGYANSVSGAGWLWFAARVEMAATSLREAPASASQTPLWYTLSIDIGIDQAKKLAQMRAIFDEGAARFPDYLPLYSAMLRVLQPRWYGSYLDTDRFINAQYAKAAPRTGFQMYARLYWIDAEISGDDVDIFTDGSADWNSMKTGFQQLVARYPRSDYVLNVFANFACRSGDKPEYAALRSQLASRFSASAWSGEYKIGDCDRRMEVSNPAPIPALQAAKQ